MPKSVRPEDLSAHQGRGAVTAPSFPAGRLVRLDAGGKAEVVLENGATILADASNGLAAGGPVLVSVRPERMRPLEPGDEAEAELEGARERAEGLLEP